MLTLAIELETKTKQERLRHEWGFVESISIFLRLLVSHGNANVCYKLPRAASSIKRLVRLSRDDILLICNQILPSIVHHKENKLLIRNGSRVNFRHAIRADVSWGTRTTDVIFSH